ncbi:3-hydroxyacyl-CoA dehydrogenase family protein [soil metagenome]
MLPATLFAFELRRGAPQAVRESERMREALPLDADIRNFEEMTERDIDSETSLRRIGVVGAGVIGASVAQALAQTGHDVVLVDISEGALSRAEVDISRNVRFHHLVSGENRLDVGSVLSKIAFTEDYAALGDSELVIENATEVWAVKLEVFGRLDEVCSETCTFAANTSAFPITKLGAATRRPDRVVGIHFMNPVPLKPVAEVIPGGQTSAITLARALALLEQMGKEGIVVGDSPGFVSNRVLMLTVNEAAFLVYEGVASAQIVDDIFKKCFGHPMGPLETADLIGVDTVLRSIEVLHDEFSDDKYRPCPLLQSMVAAGALGRKSGSGFHEYAGKPPRRGEEAVR